jgi:hypothetical protein
MAIKSKRPAKNDWHAKLRRKFSLQREAEALDLCAIVTEHDRGHPHATALALAATVKELRANLKQLKFAIDGALDGGGYISLQHYGPHRDDNMENTIRLAQKQLLKSS